MRNRIAAIVILTSLCGALVTAQSGQDLFRQGRTKEKNGDYEGAIQLYERIVRESASKNAADKDLRQLLAETKMHMGDCWIKIGGTDEARGLGLLNEVIANYKELTGVVTEAKQMIALASSVAPTRTPLEIATPFTHDPFSFAISPDGRSLVFLATVGGKTSLWLREIDSQKQRPIPGTESSRYGGVPTGANPFWKPDGRFIGYFDDQKLKSIPVGGGVAKTLADAPRNARGTWSIGGVIVFAPDVFGRLYRVSGEGGDAAMLPLVPLPRANHRYPDFASDEHLLIFVGQNRSLGGLWLIGSLNSSETRSLPLQSDGAAFAAPNHIVFVSGGGLYVQGLDPQRMELTGARGLLTDRVAVGQSGHSAFSVSAKGQVAYRADVSVGRRPIWLDRLGRKTGELISAALSGLVGVPRFSPDGETVMLNHSGQVLLVNVADGGLRRLSIVTNGGSVWPASPIWSPDGTLVLYSAVGALPYYDIFQRTSRAESPGQNRMLVSEENKIPLDWYGDVLLYASTNPTTSRNLLAVRVRPMDPLALAATPSGTPYFLEVDGDPIPVVATFAQESNGRFSPDGAWIAYESDELEGRNEIFVQPFPGTPALRRRVSKDGGSSPEWSRDGRELFFLSEDNHLMVVAITLPASGQAIGIGTPSLQFPSPLPDGATYAPSPDGQRFLVNTPIEAPPPIYVLQDLKPAQK